ncbi:type II toxin-antitoxin system RelE/ParE family toxin [Flavobacterium sp.]|uniref:type II toxin-antitoxin system RelE/ParE family toxin n=1 Tax=Flavobacterium sp. TaxID=239 RepID=UPI00286BAD3E|nr:type II toxin-antitoxin system RelE/ParE family toxin [Flavobacterium sp.]
MKIKFSKIAQLEYEEIINYLYDNFGKEKAIKFSDLLKKNLNQVNQFPESFSFFQNTDKRKFMLNPYITVIYNVNKDLKCIEILNFWFNRSNPEVLLQHL